MEKLLNEKSQPMPLKELLKQHDVRLWQVVKRFLSNGIHMNEGRLSRILNGIEEGRTVDMKQLESIERELRAL